MKPYPEYKDSGVQWLEEIPVSWSVKKLKYMTAFQTGWTPPTKNPEYFIGSNVWVTITDLNRKFISDSIQKISDEAVKIARMAITPKGSLMYSFKLSLGKVAFANRDLYTNEAIISIKPQNDIDLNYLYYCLPSQLLNNANENIYGAKILNQELMRNTFLVFSSLPEQKQIAKYLNHKTAKIDAVIEKKKRLIELLKEERTAVINQAVTKGLDPNVPMKDSGIEWLGEVPEHWEVKKLKFVASLKSGNSITSESIEAEGAFPVYGGNGLRGYYSLYTHEGEYVLIGRQGALCGNINYASGKFWASEHAVVATLTPEHLVNWFGELLRIMNLNQYSQSAAQPGLAVDGINNLYVPVPLKSEQKQIVQYMEKETTRIDSIISTSEKEIDLLQEYRTALISEVVTGKIDVREEKI